MSYSRQCKFNSLGTCSYFKKWLWNLRTKGILHYFRELKYQLWDISGT